MNGNVQFQPPYTVKPDDIKAYMKNKEITVGNWLITFALLIIPLVNIIMLCIWSFSEKINVSKRNFCRAVLIISIIFSSIILSLISVNTIMNIYIIGG